MSVLLISGKVTCISSLLEHGVVLWKYETLGTLGLCVQLKMVMFLIVTRSVRGMFVRTVRRDQEKGDRSISDVWWRIVCAYLVQNKHNYIGV